MTHRPKCVSCGARYGSRRVTTETVRWPKGEPIPAYTGPGTVTNTDRPYRQFLNAFPPTFTTERAIWDGVSYDAPYRPFCTLRCALKYARHAYNATVEARP